MSRFTWLIVGLFAYALAYYFIALFTPYLWLVPWSSALWAVASLLRLALGVWLLYSTARVLEDSVNVHALTRVLAGFHTLSIITEVVLYLWNLTFGLYAILIDACLFGWLYAAVAVCALVSAHRARRRGVPATPAPA